MQAWRDKHETQISDRLLAKYDNYEGTDELATGITMLPFKKALRKKTLNPKQALIIKGLALDKLPLGIQQVKRGIAASAPCALCGYENDDYFHRLAECTHPEAEELRAKVDQVYLNEVIQGGRDNVHGQVLLCKKSSGFYPDQHTGQYCGTR